MLLSVCKQKELPLDLQQCVALGSLAEAGLPFLPLVAEWAFMYFPDAVLSPVMHAFQRLDCSCAFHL